MARLTTTSQEICTACREWVSDHGAHKGPIKIVEGLLTDPKNDSGRKSPIPRLRDAKVLHRLKGKTASCEFSGEVGSTGFAEVGSVSGYAVELDCMANGWVHNIPEPFVAAVHHYENGRWGSVHIYYADIEFRENGEDVVDWVDVGEVTELHLIEFEKDDATSSDSGCLGGNQG